MRLKLREVRERKFLSQQELADRAETTKANISRLERGEQQPRPSTIRKLAEALGVPPEELIDWTARDEKSDPEMGKAAA